MRRGIFILLLVASEACGVEIELDFEPGLGVLDGLVLTDASAPEGAKAAVADQPDSAGDHVLELADGSQLHGTLVSLGKNEVIWKRGDASEPLTFLPGDVRRLVLGKPIAAKDAGANATLKFPGGDWLAGVVNTFANGKFTVGLGAGLVDDPVWPSYSMVTWLFASGRRYFTLPVERRRACSSTKRWLRKIGSGISSGVSSQA